ncbi:MAG: right-handed parallel beta-helix repeat-containing protein [Acidimicrobiia bacterium]|nr:right-handed parallel beta-helix repeat-containing protein [Acidimicrobiia bacterium]
MRAEKRAKKAARKAEKAARRAEELQAAAALAPTRRRRSGRKLAGLGLSTIALLGAAGAGVWFYLQQRNDEVDRRPADVTVEAFGDFGTAIVIRNGAASINEVAATPAVIDRGLATFDGDTITFTRPLIAGEAAHLSIVDWNIRLRSDPEAIVPFIAQGADIKIRNASISSWDGTGIDAEAGDGRAYVHLEDSLLDIDGLTVNGLGGPERGRYGLAVANGSTGTINNVTVRNGHVGLDLQGNLPLLMIDSVDVSGSTLAGIRMASVTGVTLSAASTVESVGDGLLIEGSTSDTTVTGVDAGANDGHGVSITGAAGNVVIGDSRMFRNGGRGISVANTRGVSLTANTVWANNGGIGFTGANASAEVRDSAVTGNRGGGIELASAGSSVTVTGNTLDHNEFGLRIADGSAAVELNSITENGVGVLLEDTSPQVSFTLNDIAGNFDTGFQLAEADGLDIEANRIVRNTHAAFTVQVASASEPFWDNNEVDGGRFGVERIYKPLREDRALADLIPVPAYFFAEEGRAFADLEQQAQQDPTAAGQP